MSRKSGFSIVDLKEEGHAYTCQCEQCRIVVRNITLFREWHEELNGTCIVDRDGNCVGCINHFMENVPATN